MWTLMEQKGRILEDYGRYVPVKVGAAVAEPPGQAQWAGQACSSLGKANRMTGRAPSDPSANTPEDMSPMIASDVWLKALPETILPRLKEGGQRSAAYFASRYATAIYGYFRRKGLPREEAKDLTADFVFQKIVAGDFLDRYEREEGRFRSLLLPALRNYLYDYWRRMRRENEGKEALKEDLKLRPEGDLGKDNQADDIFVCDCVHDQLQQVLWDVGQQCNREGLADHFAIFCLRHFTWPRPTWSKVGRAFGVSWQDAKNRAWTVRERLANAVLEEFGGQNILPDQAQEVVQDLVKLFEGQAGRDFSERSYADEIE